jgi:hypothetical protein
MNESAVFKKIIDPKFIVTELDWDTKVGLAATLVENREIYQKALGKLANSLPRPITRRGDGQLAKFAMAIENLTGRKTSANSLRVYRLVYERLEKVIDQIPPDWPYRAWRALAGSGNPEGWLMEGVQKGMSGPEIIREIKLSKGITDTPKVCKNCGAEQKLDPKICFKCHTPLI